MSDYRPGMINGDIILSLEAEIKRLEAELEKAKSIISDLLEDDRQSTREMAKEFLNKV